jgi:NAD(P)-dependent dehydrogenase (short-subunit alcohol dehydrogenase family)
MQRTIIITGAAGNLGQEVVNTLSKENHQLIASTGSGEIPPELIAKTIDRAHVDLANENAAMAWVHEMTTQHPSLDAAVLLVGGFAPGSIDQTDETMLDKQITLNFKTAWFVIRPLLEHFKRKGFGQIILIGARPAIQPFEGKNVVAYALSKSLLFSLAEMINADANETGVTASVIVPGVIDTPPNRKAMPQVDPGRWVNPSDIAETIGFILSPAGRTLRQPVFKVYNKS